MHFDLSDEQKQFESGVQRLLTDIVDPVAMTRGRESIDRVRANLEPKLVEMGVPAILVSEAHGGMAMGLLTLCALADGLGRHAAPSGILHTALAAWLLAESDDDALRGRWLEPVMSGSARAAIAIPGGVEGWWPSASRIDAPGDGLRKLLAETADRAELIIAITDGSLVVVGAEDVTIEATKSEPLDMTRPVLGISFDARAGRRMGGSAERLFDALLVLTAADAAGAGRRSYQMAVEYAKTREQFGCPIGSFQAIKHQLANMAVEIEPVRFLCWYAAHAWDTNPQTASRATSLAKAHACDVAIKTARASVEAHGGIGYTWEYPLHLFLKRAMHDRIMYGTPAALRSRVAELTQGMRSELAEAASAD